MKPILALLLLLASHAQAGSNTYLCQITGYLSPPGTETNVLWVASAAMKTPLAIDRMTGRAVHPSLGNTSFPDVRVLDPGGEGWTFRVVARSQFPHEVHGHVRYYEVHDYVEAQHKPLLVIGEGFAFTGLCE